MKLFFSGFCYLLTTMPILQDVEESDINLAKDASINSNVKLGKGLIRMCDKITIYHAPHGSTVFEGEQLADLLAILDKGMRDEWWTKCFITRGNSSFRIMIELSVKSKIVPDKYEIVALFPLNSQVWIPGRIDELRNLLDKLIQDAQKQ